MKKVKLPLLVDEGTSAPSYSTEEAAGADVRAFIDTPITIQPGERLLIPTGLKVAIPPGFEIQVRPRSGLALKEGITILNSPGTIDSDYRGEIGIILIHHGTRPFVIEPGMRIAQLVLTPVVQADFVEHEALIASERGAGGFGSTGRA